MTSSTYYSNVRQDVIDLIPRGHVARALEIGGGDFTTLLQLRERQNFEAWGVDIRSPSAPLDHFLEGSITDIATYSELPDDGFDLIVANDVIEHIIDTDTFIAVLYRKLAPGGILALSVPNARQIRFAYHVFLRGRFPRTDAGLFDRTHLRWFCKRDVVEMFTKAGFSIVTSRSVGRLVPNVLARTTLAEFLALQNIFCLTK